MTLAEAIGNEHCIISGFNHQLLVTKWDVYGDNILEPGYYIELPDDINWFDFRGANEVYEYVEDENCKVHALLPWLDEKVYDIGPVINLDIINQNKKGANPSALLIILLSEFTEDDKKILKDKNLVCKKHYAAKLI